MVGNRGDVQLSSRGTGICDLTESLYRPIFGDDIRFHRGSGKSFVEKALADPSTSAAVIFGFDENVLPYEEAFRRTGKKLIFEGPGQDPFIVFPDADLPLALSDLMTAEVLYSGQTCTAPKRIFVHRSGYEEFLDRVEERRARA